MMKEKKGARTPMGVPDPLRVNNYNNASINMYILNPRNKDIST